MRLYFLASREKKYTESNPATYMDDMRTVFLIALGLALFLPGLIVIFMQIGDIGLLAVGGLFILGALLIVWSDLR